MNKKDVSQSNMTLKVHPQIIMVIAVVHAKFTQMTQSWGSVLPSIVETRDQNSRGCPLLFSNRNLGSLCA